MRVVFARHFRRRVLQVIAAAVGMTSAASMAQSSASPVEITIDAKAAGTPFPHFWEQMFGSGRAILSLRQSYRDDVRTVKDATDFQYIRFHAIFHDEVGLFDLTNDGKPVYNFSYIDQIYDGLLAQGVKPFVELGFMPKKMSSNPDALHAFWYKPNVSPPKDYALWDGMIDAFARHLIERYGTDEVASWYFEVWNEPNLDFWGGHPEMPTYYTLYEHTAKALKAVSPRLRVGGPSTAQAAYVADFLNYSKEHNLPVDFVSTHVYANDSAEDVFHTHEQIPRDKMVCRSVKKVHDEIAASPYPGAPLIFSEYNASYANEPNVTDSIFMGSWLASTISQCDGLTKMMSYWSFSDVFEEQGVVKTPFYGGYGLVAADSIPKPALNAFAMLHLLGDTRLPAENDSTIATKRKDGAVVLALWNYAPPIGTGAGYTKPEGHTGTEKRFTVRMNDAHVTHATVWRLDEDHGNVIKAYDAMGRPATPSREQIAALRSAAKAAAPERIGIRNGVVNVTLPFQGLVVLEIQ